MAAALLVCYSEVRSTVFLQVCLDDLVFMSTSSVGGGLGYDNHNLYFL